MVIPSPFDRLLQDLAQQANRDPALAFARFDEVAGKAAAPDEVLKLGALAVHVGAAMLGRFTDTVTAVERLMRHPALAGNAVVTRSLWRALAVVHRCAGNTAAAETAIVQGVVDDADRARLAIMTAQTLAARGRLPETAPYCQECARLLPALQAGDDVLAQAAAIGANLARVAEGHLRQAQQSLHSACAVIVAATAEGDWTNRHRALFQRGKAYLLTGEPVRTLSFVQEMMTIEDSNDAGPEVRFYTAALACRAQTARGQMKVAAGALEACREFANRCPQDKAIQDALLDLVRAVNG